MSTWTPSTPEAAREYLRSANGPTPNTHQPDSLEKAVVALETRVADFSGRTREAVRELVIRDDLAALRKEHGTDKIPDRFLSPDYQEALAKEAAARFDAETRDESHAIQQAIEECRTTLVAKMVGARRLPSESERINPTTNHAGWIQAKLLDTITERDAREWTDAHADDPQAILARLESADDRADNAFVREVERRYGFAPDEPIVTESDPSENTRRLLSPLQKSVRARQAARVPKALSENYARLERASAAYAFAAAEAKSDTLGMTRALLQKAR